MTDRPGPALVPLQQLVSAMDAEVDPFRRAWRLIDAFEWPIKDEPPRCLPSTWPRSAGSPERKSRRVPGGWGHVLVRLTPQISSDVVDEPVPSQAGHASTAVRAESRRRSAQDTIFVASPAGISVIP